MTVSCGWGALEMNVLIWMQLSCFSCLAHLLNQNRTSDILMAYHCHISSGLRLLNQISFCLGVNFKLWEHKWTHKPKLHTVQRLHLCHSAVQLCPLFCLCV